MCTDIVGDTPSRDGGTATPSALVRERGIESRHESNRTRTNKNQQEPQVQDDAKTT